MPARTGALRSRRDAASLGPPQAHQARRACDQAHRERAHHRRAGLLTREAARTRRRRRTPATATSSLDLLSHHAGAALAAGHPDAALAAATEAANLSARLHPNGPRHAKACYALGRTLAKLGRDEAALAHLQQAVAIGDTTDHDDAALTSRALFAANTALALQRLGQVTAALDLAARAVHLASAAPEEPIPHLRTAGLGWAHTALSLARTDGGLDGRPAAQEALEAFRRVDGEEFLAGGEGLALACYAAAYAAHRQGDGQGLAPAREAVERFSGSGDVLHERRRADAARLLAEITSEHPVASGEDAR
ncbi:hypothetical protein [Catellatospora chokoriensis]|uniref:Tetratricopeptide repeat protein n=1 Tax=Catellatospora chokoriensis TaxID=310353 RepID=A0A8J3JWH5_9ACTN|nr:hypothetical protein [Catellatospora chokoriensis]GIF88381.1 hypothetical protein Cch02nite_18250 [Catellatospora chokoriensis]